MSAVTASPIPQLAGQWMETKPSKLANFLPYYDSKWYMRWRF